MQQKVLILIPTLNSYKSLEKLVKSLEEQSSNNWRVLFVDGLSSKKHREYLKKICAKNKKLNWKIQKDPESGIFGAMNEGFSQVNSQEWLLFWGSDDWLPSKDSLTSALNKLNEVQNKFGNIDIFTCKARYFSCENNIFTRYSYFIRKNKLINFYYFKLLLFFGRTPPHQTTFLSNSCRDKINKFSNKYKLSADLKFFLDLSNFKKIKVYSYNYNLLYLSEGGVSGIKTFSRLKEVLKAYWDHFGLFSIVTISLRYFFRIKTKFFKNKIL